MKQCTKKSLSKQEATIAIKLAKQSHKQYRRETRYYFCEECNAWHLTSREDPPEEIEELEVVNKEKWESLIIKKENDELDNEAKNKTNKKNKKDKRRARHREQ